MEELGEQLVLTGRRQRRLEQELTRLDRRLADLNTVKGDLVSRLATDRESIVQLIAALERLGRRPATLSLFQPKSALETARSVGVISNMVPLINARSAEVRTNLESLVRVEDSLIEEQQNLVRTEDSLRSGKVRLNRLIAARREEQKDARDAAAAESSRLTALRDEASDLETVLQELFARQPTARPDRVSRPAGTRNESSSTQGSSRPEQQANRVALMTAAAFKRLKGQLIQPVTGELTLRFGDQDGVLRAQGERLKARQNAEVLAPHDGRVVFSAPFREYGEVLIIEHAEGYHSLLAGLGSRYVDEGQSVLAGEPVGAMGPAFDDTGQGVDLGGTASSTKSDPELYLELRERGTSVDPAPWYQR